MKISTRPQVTLTGNVAWIVELVDDDDRVVEREEWVEEKDVSEVQRNLKREHYRVQDYLEEMSDLQFDTHYDGKQTHKREKVYGDSFSSFGPQTNEEYEMFHYTCTVKRFGKEWTLPYSTGTGITEDPDMSGVLECILDDALSVQAYSQTRDNPAAMGSWAEDLGYGQIQGGIARAVREWNGCWDEWEICQQLFTDQEREDIQHAFEEGHRR